MYDLVVIGGGSGGLNVAAAAAKVGAKVALIEKDRLGGEGRSRPAVPSKGLIQAAKLVHQVGEAARFGLRTGPLQVDFAAVHGHVRAVAAEICSRRVGRSPARPRGSRSITARRRSRLTTRSRSTGPRRFPSQRFVIATGSRPAVPAIPGLAEAGYLDDHSLWSLTKLPESLIVLGVRARPGSSLPSASRGSGPRSRS